MDLSVVVPVKNEEENIVSLVDEICSAQTWERLVALSQGLSHLKIIRHRKSYGQSNAIHTGVKAARSSLIVTLDGDGQNDPADISRLVEVFNAPNSPPDLQLVIGHRRKRMDSWVKRVSARVANGVRGYLLKDRTFWSYPFLIICTVFSPHLFCAAAGL
jgi:dolichol-phosphate mannosyltransferase